MSNWEIHEFALKWLHIFENENTTIEALVEDQSFPETCCTLGFEMDCGEQFEKAFPNQNVFNGGAELEKIIRSVDDAYLLGSAIFSQWRYFNHWSFSPSEIMEPENRSWFIIALNRLVEITDGTRMSNITIQRISITDIKADAIVNAANSQLMQGGGVCGAIFKAAGPVELAVACQKYGYCETGKAVITPGFKSKAKYIIHAVGPIYNGNKRYMVKEQLRNSYLSALSLAMSNGCHSIAFPLISAGIYGYPMKEAWEEAIWACNRFIHENVSYQIQIVFAVLDAHIIEEGNKQLEQLRTNSLVQVFENTRQLSVSDPRIAPETFRMKDNSRLYMEDFQLCEAKIKCENGNNIEVVNLSSYECAKKYANENRVAVLNFANAHHPGGGVVHGARAQEEHLCRTSNLYEGLIRQDFLTEYYSYHERKSALATDRLLYHPEVMVFRNDDLQLMSESEWFRTDVITCAAPRTDSGETQFQIHYSRGKNIIHAAIHNDVDVLILGAFGCGAFHNDPWIVAKAYRKLLVEDGLSKSFKKVVFAILSDHNDKGDNLVAFKDTFEIAETPEDDPRTFVFFWKLNEKNEEFSQWYPCTFTVEGIEYSSAEQYMMAKKALLFGDLFNYQRIMRESDPEIIKKIGKDVTPFDKGKWSSVNFEVLLQANMAKFSQNQALKDKLLATEDSILAEASPHDVIYGIGLDSTDPKAYDPQLWKGKNVLGKVLMQVRDELRG